MTPMQKFLSPGKIFNLGRNNNLMPKLTAIAFGVLVFGVGNFVLTDKSHATENCVQMQDYSLMDTVRHQSKYSHPGDMPAYIEGQCDYGSALRWQMSNPDGSRDRLYYDFSIKPDGSRDAEFRLVREKMDGSREVMEKVQSSENLNPLIFKMTRLEFLASIAPTSPEFKKFSSMKPEDLEKHAAFVDFADRRGNEVVATIKKSSGITQNTTFHEDDIISLRSSVDMKSILETNEYHILMLAAYLGYLEEKMPQTHKEVKKIGVPNINKTVAYRVFEEKHRAQVLEKMGIPSEKEYLGLHIDVAKGMFKRRNEELGIEIDSSNILREPAFRQIEEEMRPKINAHVKSLFEKMAYSDSEQTLSGMRR